MLIRNYEHGVCPMHFNSLQYSVRKNIISELFRLVEKNQKV